MVLIVFNFLFCFSLVAHHSSLIAHRSSLNAQRSSTFFLDWFIRVEFYKQLEQKYPQHDYIWTFDILSSRSSGSPYTNITSQKHYKLNQQQNMNQNEITHSHCNLEDIPSQVQHILLLLFLFIKRKKLTNSNFIIRYDVN
jgi:hypothetical protein